MVKETVGGLVRVVTVVVTGPVIIGPLFAVRVDQLAISGAGANRWTTGVRRRRQMTSCSRCFWRGSTCGLGSDFPVRTGRVFTGG